MGLFDATSAEDIRRLSKTAIEPTRAKVTAYDLAVKYLAGDQEENVRQELASRFPSSQNVASGQQIYPQTIPFTERYIAEAANAYDKGCKRKLVGPDGEESEATKTQSDALNKHLDLIQYDETMLQVDQFQNLIESCGLWYQQRRGRLRAKVILPQNISIVLPEGDAGADVEDQDDIHAYLVRLGAKGANTRYAWVSRSEVAYYEAAAGVAVSEMAGDAVHPNPWQWEQVPVGNPSIAAGAPVSLPLMPIVWWHRQKPIGTILPTTDAMVVNANRELNIAWSVLHDTFRFQAFDTLVKTLMNPEKPGAFQRHGARFPVVLGLQETCDYIHSSVSFTDLSNLLLSYQKLFAMLKRMSPNDFSIEATAAVSGFAKLVDSLPKIEARAARILRLRSMETQMAWPRICAILIWLGVLDESARQMRLVVDYPDISFPKTPEEETQEIDRDVKYNLDTPAHVLSRRRGISVEDAEKEIVKNAEINARLKAAGPQPEPLSAVPPLGSLIGRRSNANADNPGTPDGSPARRTGRFGGPGRGSDRGGQPNGGPTPSRVA